MYKIHTYIRLHIVLKFYYCTNKLTRIYTDIIGRINQQIATHSDEVYFVVSGIPMKIKG